MLKSPKPITDEADSSNAAVPNHVAIIMDGNGRWATERGLSRSEGHKAGKENIRKVLPSFVEHGVKYLTLFGFSTENWERPADEVDALIELLADAVAKETEPLHREGVRLRHVGRLDRLPPQLQEAIRNSEELTRDNATLNLSVAFNYGGRAEIVDAVKAVVASGLSPDEVTADSFESYLYTADLPDVDLIVRTAGEMRLSNFLLWRGWYAEYYSTEVWWPDFNEQEVAKAIVSYGGRQRRYGRVASS